VNKGEMRKYLTLVNSTQERSKDRHRDPEPKSEFSKRNAAPAMVYWQSLQAP
jgi:hypothetical protein